MTGKELRELRRRAGLGPARFGVALGYGGLARTAARAIRRMEGLNGEDIPSDAAERARRFERGLDRLEARWAAALD